MPVNKKESRVNPSTSLGTGSQELRKTKTAVVSLRAPRNDVKRVACLSIPVYSLAGKVAGSLELPKELFGAKINQALLAQAIRVYQTNQKAHWSNTKTRGEVEGSTRKIYRQKGTGGARHGARRAPIFVGGGIALGPKYRKTVLDLPKKMKKAALISALSQKAQDQEVLGITGLEKITGKTKEMVRLVSRVNPSTGSTGSTTLTTSTLTTSTLTTSTLTTSTLGIGSQESKLSALILIGDKNDLAVRAVRNIKGVDVLPAGLVSILDVIKHHSLILTKEAVEKLQERLLEKASK